MIKEQCYICKGKTEVLYEFNTRKNDLYNLLVCQDCCFLRINPIPDQNIIDGLYKNRSMPESKLEKEVFSSSFLTSLKKYVLIKPQLKKLRQFVNRAGNPKLLDIGCSTGWITDVSREAGFDATGLEANAHVAEYGRNKYGLDIIEGYIEDLETDLKFDAVTMFHVLEHIADPRNMLNQVKGLLNKNGKLLIVVPNSESLGAGIFKKNYNWNIPHHISFFSPDTIREILTQSGFRVIGVEHLISPPLLTYSYNKLMSRREREGKYSLKMRNWIISNALFLPLSLFGKLSGRGEVIAVYGEKV